MRLLGGFNNTVFLHKLTCRTGFTAAVFVCK
jgi:hypothetical protein